ncbi:hypothetical protein SK128_017398 [Halocaridina rubra]|uniref:XRCC4 coiled-coil domain-containing protein n=1 Tax=Halocaridina rubra TaxID=373956 RepID=A0AAN8X2T6_HALRR
MGLKCIIQDEETMYLYTSYAMSDQSSSIDCISVVLVQGQMAYSVKLNLSSKSIIKWSHNLEQTPQQYVEALQNTFETYSESSSNDKQDIFELQQDCLIWKQYFPDKKLHGRRGQFSLEKISYEEAINEILNGTVSDLYAKEKQIQRIKEEKERLSKELQDAKALVSKSVQMKEDFEEEIYGKCTVLLNAKKLKIKQLMSGHSSSSGECSVSDVSQKRPANAQSSSQKGKSGIQKKSESDGYSSDTDVDNPDENELDTDEENKCKATTQKHKKNAAKPNKQPVATTSKHMFDSQDKLFNNSLDAELYGSPDIGSKKRKASEIDLENGCNTGSKTTRERSQKNAEAINQTESNQRTKTSKTGESNLLNSKTSDGDNDFDTQVGNL